MLPQACDAAQNGLAPFKKHVDQLEGDFRSTHEQALKHLSDANELLTKAAVLLNETILAYCFRALVIDSSSFNEKEIQKRRSLLVRSFAEFSDGSGDSAAGKYGQVATMMNPAFLAQCKVILKTP